MAGTVVVPDDDGVRVTPFLWTRGVRVDMPLIPGWEGRSSRVVDLDARGEVLGMGLDPASFERGFVWDGATITPVGDLSRFGGNGVVDLDDRGRVLGAELKRGPFLWDDGILTTLGGFPQPEFVAPVALNDRGDVAGTTGR